WVRLIGHSQVQGTSVETAMSKNIPDAVRNLSRERASEFYRLTQKDAPGVIEIGQIWSTHSHLSLPGLHESFTDEPRLIVILDGSGSRSDEYGQVTAVPISLHIAMATDYDLVIP